MPGVRIIAACVVGYASQTCSVTMSGAQLRHVYSNRRAARHKGNYICGLMRAGY